MEGFALANSYSEYDAADFCGLPSFIIVFMYENRLGSAFITATMAASLWGTYFDFSSRVTPGALLSKVCSEPKGKNAMRSSNADRPLSMYVSGSALHWL